LDAFWEGNKLTIIGFDYNAPYYVHSAMKSLFNLDDDKVRVIQVRYRWCFWWKRRFSIAFSCHCALLSKKSGKRVRIAFTEKKIFSIQKTTPTISKSSLSIRKDGRFWLLNGNLLWMRELTLQLSPVVLSRSVLHMTAPYE
jgi:hypothetical protein